MQITHEEIAARAYLRHLQHPDETDQAELDWMEAERELVLEKLGVKRLLPSRSRT